MTNITHLTPYQHPSLPVVAELRIADLTDAEIESLRRQNPELAERLHFPPITYDNGVPADGLSGVGHG